VATSACTRVHFFFADFGLGECSSRDEPRDSQLQSGPESSSSHTPRMIVADPCTEQSRLRWYPTAQGASSSHVDDSAKGRAAAYESRALSILTVTRSGSNCSSACMSSTVRRYFGALWRFLSSVNP